MTHYLMGRPIPRTVGSSTYGPALAGGAAALLGLAATAVPVLVLWVLSPDSRATAPDAARLVGCLWLLAHGGPLTRGGGTVPLSLTPLLPTLLAALLAYRAGARSAGTAGARLRGVPAVLCAGYLAVALPVALECSTAGPLRARALPDLLAVAVLAYVGAAAGARALPGPPRWWPALRQRIEGWTGPVPGWARPAGGVAAVRRAATAALLTLAAGGALLLLVAALLRPDGPAPTIRALTGGSVAGVAGLLLTCLLLMPNAVVWSAAYALGPGFLLGTGTAVAPGRVVLGAVPDFPLVALAPGAASPWQDLVYAVPVLAGLVGAGLLGRAAVDSASDEEGASWHPAATALAAVGSALAVGAAVVLAAWLAGGALGAGRMATTGPPVWWSGALAAGWLAAVAVPGASALRWWLLRRTAEAQPRWPSWRAALTARPRALLARAREVVAARRGADE